MNTLSLRMALFSSCMEGQEPPTEITHSMLHEFLYVFSCVCLLVQAGKRKLCKAWFNVAHDEFDRKSGFEVIDLCTDLSRLEHLCPVFFKSNPALQ